MIATGKKVVKTDRIGEGYLTHDPDRSGFYRTSVIT